MLLTGQTIPAGNLIYTFGVTVIGDFAIEPDETFTVIVSNVVGASVSDDLGIGTIVNDDVAVPYTFTGFFPPVDNPPALNAVNAGRAIPVKFSLGGDQGLGIFAAGYPASQEISCAGGSPIGALTAGVGSLSYDATTDRYNYVWKTQKAWKGTCRKLISSFSDSSEQHALFRFR